MTICDAQRKLIAAGQRIGADGIWGKNSKDAFTAWAQTQGAMSVALPTFGTREDYKKDGARIRLPAAYASALPAPARVACGAASRAATSTSTATSTLTSGKTSGASPGAAIDPSTPAAADPTEPDGGETVSPGTGESVGFMGYLSAYGPWVALAAVVAGGGGYWWWKRKHAKAA
jgi:hypothetical protein